MDTASLSVMYPSTLSQLVCRLQYHWSRNYKTLTPSQAREFGSAIHHALEAHYGSDMDPIKAFRGFVRLNYIEDVDLGITMLRNYFVQYKNENFEVLATELEIARRIPVPDDELDPPKRAKRFRIGARVDTIVRDKTLDKVFVLEHKTFSRFYKAGLELDHQFVVEAFVAEGWLGEPIAGVLYNGLRKSKKETATTKLFERHPIYISEHAIEVMLHRAYWTLIDTTADDFHIYPEPGGMTCSFCQFKSPCAEYMRGGDWKFILNNAFKKRERSDSEWVVDHA